MGNLAIVIPSLLRHAFLAPAISHLGPSLAIYAGTPDRRLDNERRGPARIESGVPAPLPSNHSRASGRQTPVHIVSTWLADPQLRHLYRTAHRSARVVGRCEKTCRRANKGA